MNGAQLFSKKHLGLAALISGAALCCFGISVLLRTPQFEAVARVQFTQGKPGEPDPDFRQPEKEVLRLHGVLSNTVERLNLTEDWDAEKLVFPEAIHRLLERINAGPGMCNPNEP